MDPNTSEIRSEIFSKRLIAAVVWNIGLQTLLAVTLVFLIQADVLHPVTWISSTLRDVCGMKMIFNIVPLVLVCLFQAFIYGKYYNVAPPKYFTRFSMFLNMFSIQNVIFIVLYALSGYFTMSLYSSLANNSFNVLKKKCTIYNGQCLIEKSLFLQLGGMWMGLYYFLNIHVFGTTLLIFPHIYQNKFQQVKLAIKNISLMGFRNSIRPVFYYCTFYYIWGNKPRMAVSDVYSLYLEDAPLDGLINLLTSGIWISLWFYTSMFFISVYTMRTVFNIVLTEPLDFPIESESQLTLNEALGQTFQLNGILAALDFKLLALQDPLRRTHLFTLSQPGGHAHNWNNLLEKSLKNINNFIDELENINNNIKPMETDSLTANSLSNTLSTGFAQSHVRNLVEPQSLDKLKDIQKYNKENRFTNAVKADFNSFLHKLSQKPGINFFFGELTDTKLKVLLIQAQPIMWTCEGLAFIAASSLTEDKYGIVQNDLPAIITTIVKLKQILEKLTKLGIAQRRNILNDVFATKMKTALMSAVKRSIYKIVITFSKYINEIPLEPDIQVAIYPFIMYKEA